MRVALPSGHYAEFRDVLMRGDRRDAQRGLVIVIGADGSRRLEGSIASDMAARVIRRMLVSWDFDPGRFPLPGQCQTEDLFWRVLDELDDDDAQALEGAVGPWVEKILRPDRGAVLTHVPSGIQVVPVNQADREKLLAHADFAAGDEADPKPALTSTATGS